jgi:uncharacterized protein
VGEPALRARLGGSDMSAALRKTTPAVLAPTDRGEFIAIAAAYTVDRANERIVPGAFQATIVRWRGSGKMIPLQWNHSGAAEDVIGVVVPAEMRETEFGLQVVGRLDLDGSSVAREAWRLMKKDAVSLSFGYLVVEAGQGVDGVRELKALDLFEISLVTAPANPDTRIVSMKSRPERARVGVPQRKARPIRIASFEVR